MNICFDRAEQQSHVVELRVYVGSSSWSPKGILPGHFLLFIVIDAYPLDLGTLNIYVELSKHVFLYLLELSPRRAV